MLSTAKLPFAQTASEVMRREVAVLSQPMTLREAAGLLRRSGASAAAVVDEQGRCLGTLSAVDFLRWAEEGCPGADERPAACAFQVKGRLITGEPAVICTLAEGRCPLQVMRPTLGGRQTAICLDPTGIVNDWQAVPWADAGSEVARYMRADPVTAGPHTPLTELARWMAEAGADHAAVLDDRGRPIGLVYCTDVLAALAGEEAAGAPYEESTI